ncbi:hypothetical protein VaNZ11_002017 [Volvox africanus]|uniref:FIST domain-containing protein n=1 Tax=Volvox africanus TaxID=51714 RepID=A0ABQ5RSG6_9CHLO|nr:hypothetical protein VaNZ11_002017 [Volvox africanus]
MLTVPRTLSYSTCQRAVTAAEDAAIAATAGGNGNVEVAGLNRHERRGASVTAPATAATEARGMENQPVSAGHCEASSGGGGGSSSTLSHSSAAKNSPKRCLLMSLASAAIAALSGRRTTPYSVAVPPPATPVPATTTLTRPKFSAPLPPMLNSCSSTRTCATFGEVRLALAAAAAAADADVIRSGWRRRPLNVGVGSFPYPSPSSACSPRARAVPTAGDGGPHFLSWSSYWRRTLVSEPVLVGYMSAATGTLRLNPRDTSPVYPGDKLVLLVSEEARGRVNPVSSSHLPAQYGSWQRMSKRALGKDAAGRGVVQPAVGVPVAAATEAATAAAAATGVGRWRNSVTVGGSRLHFCSSDTAAAAGAAVTATATAAVQFPLTPLPPLQAWHSEPVDGGVERQLPPTDASSGPTDGSTVDVTGDNGGATRSTAGECYTAAPSSTIVRDKPAPSMHDNGDPCGVTARAASNSSQAPTRSRPTGRSLTAPPPPPPPPPHIIVISRTEEAIREVVAGLLEFAPVGSTIAMVTHESCTANVRQVNADGGASSGAGSCGHTLSAALSGGSIPITAATAAASGNTADNNGTTVVLRCPSSCWPVGESDLIVAGLAIATAVLVARDSGLQPHEADATALSAVLQLHQTLTDPTRSPLRRWPPPPPPPPLQPGTNDGASASTGETTAAAAEALPYLLGEKLPCRTAFSASSPAATASTPPAPLHVVVCLHSTRSRETLRTFLSTLNVQPPFTLEALVPEEYRALLLAGVVRQPQSHAIMTELLNDRPGSPEVRLFLYSFGAPNKNSHVSLPG